MSGPGREGWSRAGRVVPGGRDGPGRDGWSRAGRVVPGGTGWSQAGWDDPGRDEWSRVGRDGPGRDGWSRAGRVVPGYNQCTGGYEVARTGRRNDGRDFGQAVDASCPRFGVRGAAGPAVESGCKVSRGQTKELKEGEIVRGSNRTQLTGGKATTSTSSAEFETVIP